MDPAKNPADLEHLYDAHAPGLFRYLLSLAHDETEVHDRLQDIFVRLARAPGCLDGVSDVRAFLFRMARNAVIDSSRRRASQRKRIEASAGGTSQFHEDSHDTPAFAKGLESALAALPESQRSVAVLKLWEGLTFDQIGNVCGISPNTAASRYRYALDKLRTHLRPLYDEIREP